MALFSDTKLTPPNNPLVEAARPLTTLFVKKAQQSEENRTAQIKLDVERLVSMFATALDNDNRYTAAQKEAEMDSYIQEVGQHLVDNNTDGVANYITEKWLKEKPAKIKSWMKNDYLAESIQRGITAQRKFDAMTTGLKSASMTTENMEAILNFNIQTLFANNELPNENTRILTDISAVQQAFGEANPAQKEFLMTYMTSRNSREQSEMLAELSADTTLQQLLGGIYSTAKVNYSPTGDPNTGIKNIIISNIANSGSFIGNRDEREQKAIQLYNAMPEERQFKMLDAIKNDKIILRENDLLSKMIISQNNISEALISPLPNYPENERGQTMSAAEFLFAKTGIPGWERILTQDDSYEKVQNALIAIERFDDRISDADKGRAANLLNTIKIFLKEKEQ